MAILTTVLSASTGMAVLSRVLTALTDSANANRSLIQIAQAARVEPLAFVDADCQYMEMLPDVMQSALSVFSAYYLQAFQLSTLNVEGVDVIKQLDRLNPNRDTGMLLDRGQDNLVGKLNAGFESRLPSVEDMVNGVAFEAMNNKPEPNISMGGKEAGGVISESTDLSVGKLLNVSVSDGKKTAAFNIAVRLLTSIVSSDTMVHILSIKNKQQTFTERWGMMRKGYLEFWRDIVMCQDLIDEHKKNLVEDKQNMYSAILNRRTSGALSSVVTNTASAAGSSNIVVISKDTAKIIEGEIGSSLNNYATRKKLFDNTYLMLLYVVDQEHGRVTLYHNGIPESTTIAARDLRKASKGSGPSISDILAAYKLGSAPSL